MKKTLFVFIVGVGLLSAFTEKKQYTLKYDEKEVNDLWRQVTEVQLYLDHTNLPHGEVKYYQGKLDSVKIKLYEQIQPQLQQDSTRKKK